MEMHDPQVVEALIHYLYNFDYGDDGNGQTDVAGIVFDARMYIIADDVKSDYMQLVVSPGLTSWQYLIEPLRHLACKKFRKRCESDWMSADFARAIDELYMHCSDMDDLKIVAIHTIK